MAEDWSAIAAEVEGALRDIGDVSQPTGFPVTLRRFVALAGYDPDAQGTPAYTTFVALDDLREMRDQNGTLIGQSQRTLTVNATAGVEPLQGDAVAIGVTADTAAADGRWFEVTAVRPLAPAGIAVLYELDVAI